MYETEKEIKDLQRILDESRKNAGKHLLEIFTPELVMSAQQLCRYLVGIKQLAMATVTSNGKPRVAPVDAAFIHGRFYHSTAVTSFRVRHLKKNPAVSIAYFEGISVAMIVHGKGRLIGPSDEEFNNIKEEWIKHYGRKLIESLKGLVLVLIEPEMMFTLLTDSS